MNCQSLKSTLNKEGGKGSIYAILFVFSFSNWEKYVPVLCCCRLVLQQSQLENYVRPKRFLRFEKQNVKFNSDEWDSFYQGKALSIYSIGGSNELQL